MHVVFIVFCLMTNILVTAMLLTGGSAVMTSLTGVHTAAACFLLPIGVVLYTLFGGIKATFITDYMHTVVIIVVIFIFAFSAYATNENLGSPGKVYDALVAASERHPVEGNAQGSYLTMRSKEGGIFWVINLVGMYFAQVGGWAVLTPLQVTLGMCDLHLISMWLTSTALSSWTTDTTTKVGHASSHYTLDTDIPSHRRTPRPCLPRICHRRSLLVCHPLALR